MTFDPEGVIDDLQAEAESIVREMATLREAIPTLRHERDVALAYKNLYLEKSNFGANSAVGAAFDDAQAALTSSESKLSDLAAQRRAIDAEIARRRSEAVRRERRDLLGGL